MMGLIKPAKAQSRLMRHPGPVAPVRIVACSQTATRTARVELSADISLFDGLCAVMEELAIDQRQPSASFEIIGGGLAPAVFCTGIADKSGEKLATYSPWREACNAMLLGGAGTLGTGLNSQPLIHVHGWFVRSKGEVCGGHLDPVASHCGTQGVWLRLFVHDGFSLHQQEDPETGHAVLMPVGNGELAA